MYAYLIRQISQIFQTTKLKPLQKVPHNKQYTYILYLSYWMIMCVFSFYA